MTTRCFFNNLTVGCWNIQGAYEKINSVKIWKIEETTFQNTLKKIDILCLQETHLSPEDNPPEINGYVSVSHCRQISGNNRYFGGILTYIKTSIKNGIKVGLKFDEDALEITLLKNFFGLNKDVKLLFAYASPINSCYTKSRTMNVLDKIETHYIDGGNNFMIMGDLNGRTKLGEDYVRDTTDKHSPINVPFYNRDTYLSRKNMDEHTIDTQGKLILDLCKSASLRILNGRVVGDTSGKFTRYPTNAEDKPSVIDYALCSAPLITEILHFTVLPFTGISDHCCISVKIKINVEIEVIPPIKNTVGDRGKGLRNHKYTYDKNRKHIYEQALHEDTKIKALATSLEKTHVTSDDIEVAISQLDTILLGAAKKSCFVKISKIQKKHKKKQTHDWFTKECRVRRNILRRYSKELSGNPFDKTKRKKFLEARAAYKTACRKSEKAYRHLLTKKLMEVGQSDPKMFWNIINQMNNWGKKQTEPADNIPSETWIRHFEGLLNNKSQVSKTLEMHNCVHTFDPILDSRISNQELRDALCSLKMGKACGPDGIPVEYLKVFGHSFEPILLKLTRCLFAEHVYPSKWVVNFLKPIYKKGSNKDPDNYRGLAIGSAFAKLFSMILLNRLNKYIKQKDLISRNQIGFMKGASTSDHIFLLQTIIEKVVKKNKKRLYAIFIDFKKAYDTVDRDLLILRLKSLGINGVFLRNIIAMYKRTEYIVKLSSGNTCPIKSNLGLKQGCPLSPMLFNLYIDDINNIFDASCHPIGLQDETINHFLYADDLVLISESREGLQNCLNKVNKFAQSKHLTISVTKSKSMTFNQAGIMINTPIYLDDKVLEQVQSFCYLGFDVKCSGTVKHAMNVLRDKANKALRPLLCATARFNIPVTTSIRLFNTFISPIILYNAENWVTLTDKKLQNFSNSTIYDDISKSKIDATHRKLLKFVLGVSKSCPNLAVYGETGEAPISLKSYRLALNFWHRITTLPGTTLVHKALLENIALRTNWIVTIEKLVGTFDLADKIGNHERFKKTTKSEIYKAYGNHWKTELQQPDMSRLNFYKEVKGEFQIKDYLSIRNWEHRKHITKIRCSDHPLEIEKGRHTNIPRTERKCKLCSIDEIETEEHFLLRCSKYDLLKNKYSIVEYTAVRQFFNDMDKTQLGMYLVEAFALRETIINPKHYGGA